MDEARVRRRGVLAWGALYRLADSRLLAWLLAAPVRAIRRVAGDAVATRVLGKLHHVFVRTLYTWPQRTHLYINLHMSRLWRRLERHVWDAGEPVPARPRRPVAGRPLRVGWFGELSKYMGFPERFFRERPEGVRLHLFDMQYGGGTAGYLRGHADAYLPVELRRRDGFHTPGFRRRLEELAAAIRGAELDLLVNTLHRGVIYPLLDRIDTPCVVHVCPGSDLLHHERVAFHLYGQLQADFPVLDGRLWSGLTGAPFGGAPLYPTLPLYDPRGIAAVDNPSWEAREPRIFYHGHLNKLASEPMLGVLLDLLAADSDLELACMGRDDGRARAAIEGAAERRGLAGRVRYLGEFSHQRGPDGRVEDPGWERCLAELRRARLWPDSWPIPGGSARVEAYLAGTPSVHMTVRFDPASWGRPQPALLEIAGLRVEAAAATGVEAYRELCRRCLYDRGFAAAVAAEQRAIAERVTDPGAWWRRLLDHHRDWLARREGA